MRKANFCFEQNKKKEVLANWKAKKKIIRLSLRRTNLYLRRISRIIRTEIILTIKNSKEIEMVLLIIPIIPITLRASRLQTIMGISLRVLNERSLLSAGNVMARTMPRSAQTGKRQSAIFTLCRKK